MTSVVIFLFPSYDKFLTFDRRLVLIGFEFAKYIVIPVFVPKVQ